MMFGPNGQPIQGAVPIRIRSKYVCLMCGDIPYCTTSPQFPPGTPEAQIFQVAGEMGPSFHCLPCMVRIQRRQFPALVLISDAEQAMTHAGQEIIGYSIVDPETPDADS